MSENFSFTKISSATCEMRERKSSLIRHQTEKLGIVIAQGIVITAMKVRSLNICHLQCYYLFLPDSRGVPPYVAYTPFYETSQTGP